MSKRPLRIMAGTAPLVLLAGCNSEQSAFAPVGAEAERINVLFWVMTIGGGLIFVGVIALSAVTTYGGEALRSRLSGERFITGAGIAFPIVVLSMLLVHGFVVLRCTRRFRPCLDRDAAPLRSRPALS